MKEALLTALSKFVHQRPGFERGNYSTVADYQADVRRATRDLNDCRRLLMAVALSSITAEDICTQSQGTRLAISVGPPLRIDYTPCQYYHTEFRAAVCALLACCYSLYQRDKATSLVALDGGTVREGVAKIARLRFDRGMARRWFE